MNDNEEGRGETLHASPPCFMHELDADGQPQAATDPRVERDVARWRKAERETLIAARLAVSADERAGHAERIAERLDAEIGDVKGRTVGLYWPFRGEPDLRGWAARVIARGGSIALPVVVAKATPLVFRLWSPGDPLVKGVWNIPIPADGAETLPDIVVSPVVGFDGENFRLGYGGGFYDRTLAAMPRKPRVLGVGYEMQRLPTIYPQPFDIPMDKVLTEAG
jgi:5,10-methenyltetrahydrofolate synthetase